MFNCLFAISKRAFDISLLTAFVSTIYITPASSQVSSEVWATVGSVDDLVSYGAGLRFSGVGIEIGTGKKGATGGDFLTFIGLPVVSVAPYLGLGFYSGDETVAYSGGVHLNIIGIVLGAGYHSIRGVNGQLGFKF